MLTSLVYFIIYLAVVGLIAWLLIYLVDMIPVPQPFNKVAKVVIMVVCVLIVIFLLLGLVGDPGPGLKLGR
jgi:hypothetical protein